MLGQVNGMIRTRLAGPISRNEGFVVFRFLHHLGCAAGFWRRVWRRFCEMEHRPNEARHRMSGISVNFKYQHRQMPLIGAFGRSAEVKA